MDYEMWIKALKAARASAGVTQEQLAARIHWSHSAVGHVETGFRRPTMKFARAADAELDTGGLLAILLDQIIQQQPPSWFAPWRSIEAEAMSLRTFQPLLVPGLLQTEAYARAVFAGYQLYSPKQVDRLVAVRLERQALLSGEEPKLFTAIIDETALRRVVGDRDTQREQLEHLLGRFALAHVRLYVVPAAVGAHAGLSGGFVLATRPDNDHVAYVDGVFGRVVYEPDEVATVGRMWDNLLGEALSEGASKDLIEKLVSEL